MLAKKKPTVLILMGNDCNGIDKLISGSAAIVRAFYPATHGARAVSADSVMDLDRAVPPLTQSALSWPRYFLERRTAGGRTRYAHYSRLAGLADCLRERTCWQVTMYPRDYLAQLPKMGEHTGTAYSMSHGPGRSYRYYKGVSADARFWCGGCAFC